MKKGIVILFLAGFILSASAQPVLAGKGPRRATPTPTLWPTSTPTPTPTITPSPTSTPAPSPSPTPSSATEATASAQPKVLVSGRDLFLAALILFGLLYVGFVIREKLIVSVERKLSGWQKKRS